MTGVLRFSFCDAAALATAYESNLRHGRALVPELTREEPLSAVTLLLVRDADGDVLALAARIVMILAEGPMQGTALELELDGEARARLERFVAGGPGDGVPAPEAPDEPEAHADDEGGPPDPKIVRIRKLSSNERIKLARGGELEDRVLLERTFGKAVWEDLLRNPSLSAPEVARIAQKGTLPRILLDQIAENASWTRQTIVRRALLHNPRLSSESVAKLLRATPKAELKQMIQGGAYPPAVRAQMKKLLDE